MIYNYYKVDDNGEIVEKYRLDESDSFIQFKKLVKEWDSSIKEPVYDFGNRRWTEKQDDSEVLKRLKKTKDYNLSKNCQESILSGFNHEISGITYRFSYDNEAQINLQDTMRLFENEMVTQVNWTARLHGGKVRLTLMKEEFLKLYMASVKHKLNAISYYRDVLIPRVENCKTQEELDNIEWLESEISEISELIEDRMIEKRLEETAMAQAKGDTELLNLIMMGMI